MSQVLTSFHSFISEHTCDVGLHTTQIRKLRVSESSTNLSKGTEKGAEPVSTLSQSQGTEGHACKTVMPTPNLTQEGWVLWDTVAERENRKPGDGNRPPRDLALVLPLWAVHRGKASSPGCSFPISDVSRLDVIILRAPSPAWNIHDFYDGLMHLTQNLIPGLIKSLKLLS